MFSMQSKNFGPASFVYCMRLETKEIIRKEKKTTWWA